MPRRTSHREPSSPPEKYRTVSPNDPDAYPLLVAFDLDYTLWDLWIDTHVTPPLKRNGDVVNQLVDRRGQNLSFYCEVPSILAELKHRRIHVAAASRTSAPELAKEALGMLLLPANEGGDHVKAISYFNTMEIYPGSKLKHFREIHRKTGIPYEQMLFFDDEHRNFEVESLGVTMQLVPGSGTDRKLFKQGLTLWRKRRGIRLNEFE
ncbi:magnesium-dependent phosphatase-1 [Cryptococcus neoformans C23]|uniref:Magnesium-dependent phosphatase-1 n=2 Tax=Cryptococcus neoformans TaxID=5207 RepID=A0A854QA09_CRYNE|nr:magnesium-dependent phosphatase-1 [Cryptococcus neoformans var. grubii H99]AUB26784.1 magnesium-dependent phosphatase-1 [Cryptococcus neoformans var. grubii]OWZ29916.1 magnesium-dependent phosphatase-1 [Cryptococcus neoformans var. grubii AD2-60a]OWZ36756.1 magnesium-dependent phosphatase-1 [Cryptococcus neoformans var. grubii AD1-83a]OWZ41790.1 magnesium-dependent phosphatase-1 [Cryptococcus neoformans var. grubii C23]OWZ52793.1 magnesium-dependent phosphatase-1 [Cryptococcus neoformans va|eukprot:XP_012051015.1 magnesium-dependent phosphatase-1 [Cryptococcus neoformans var. grubii H99]